MSHIDMSHEIELLQQRAMVADAAARLGTLALARAKGAEEAVKNPLRLTETWKLIGEAEAYNAAAQIIAAIARNL